MSLYANLTAKYADSWYPIPRWRRALLSTLAYTLGVQIKIGSYPYGASWGRHNRTRGNDTGHDYGPPPEWLANHSDQPLPGVLGQSLPSAG